MKNLRWVGRKLYRHLSDMSWAAVGLTAGIHFLTFYVAFLLASETKIIEIWPYFWMVVVSTLGFGDFYPTTFWGMVTLIFMVPTGIGIFGLTFGKIVTSVSSAFRKRMIGMGNYDLEDHIVVLGWQGEGSRKMVHQLYGDMPDQEIVICTQKDMENPMPDHVRFIKGDSLTSEDLLERANIAKASRVIVYAENDDQTMAAGLAAYTKTRDDFGRKEHIVAYFQKESVANLFKQNCPTAEAFVSVSIEMLVRAARDPGASRVTSKLVNSLDGPTQFSVVIPNHKKEMLFGNLFDYFKDCHDATLLGVANDATGDNLTLNAPNKHLVQSGDILYYMSNLRIHPDTIKWS